jgi:hypothetical protein
MGAGKDVVLHFSRGRGFEADETRDIGTAPILSARGRLNRVSIFTNAGWRLALTKHMISDQEHAEEMKDSNNGEALIHCRLVPVRAR